VTTATATTTMQIDLTGKRALVTGGIRGIGKGITDRLRAAGATVVVAARTAPHTPSPQVITADIATVDGSATIAERTLAILGGVDIVVHNVGGAQVSPGSMTSLSDEDWDQAFQVNLFGAVRVDRALVPSMLNGQSGVIIHITSVQRSLPMPGTAPYAAAKAALANYSKALSDELAPNGIRVNSVCPGFIETEAAAAFIDDHAAALGIDIDAARAQIIKSIGGIPLGRTGDPTEVGDLVAFLASDHARYLTGADSSTAAAPAQSDVTAALLHVAASVV